MTSCAIEILGDINMIKRELDRFVVVGCFRSNEKTRDKSW
jgi:hypothetical protein